MQMTGGGEVNASLLKAKLDIHIPRIMYDLRLSPYIAGFANKNLLPEEGGGCKLFNEQRKVVKVPNIFY